MVADGKTVNIRYEESQAYMYLGIVAANAGMRQIWWGTKKRITSGELDPTSGDLRAWFASNIDETELGKLKSFRDSIFHSGVIVHPDGSIDVQDKKEGQQSYTLEQLRQWALRFAMLRFENRVEITVGAHWVCPSCGSISPNTRGMESGTELDFPCGLRMMYSDGDILTPCGSDTE